MMYYSDEARMSAIENIRDCIEKIGQIKGSELSYQDARKTSAFLSMLIDEIMKESRQHNKKGDKAMKITKIQTETVEVCPFCDQENVYPNWDVKEQGYVAQCHHCGKLIMLCDECMHDEGSCIKCDWTKEHNCFRAPDLYRN